MEYVLKNVIVPVSIAIITYVLFRSLDEWKKRRNQSLLGVAVIDTLLEELLTGMITMSESKELGDRKSYKFLPKKSWSGMNTIPDDVLLRIIAVSKNVKPVSFRPFQIRTHCKNYFDHMTETWEQQMSNTNLTNRAMLYLVNDLKFLQTADSVLKMLKQCKGLLEENAKAWFPK